jgi:D-xylose transport system ATP-binding protein
LTQPILSLRGISKRYGSVQALSGVDLDINAGEVVALVGDNGAGKSTLIKVIAGVGPPDQGTIEWEGRPVVIRDPAEAQELGIATVYQDLALCDNLDIATNLFLGREVSRFGVLDEVEMERRSRDLLQTLSVRLPDVGAAAAQLSGGQRQAVAIARSLVGQPKIVLLDEPTAALGVEQTAQVLELIERLRERGLGVILVSHNVADVFMVADRVAVLFLGKNAGFFKVADVSHEELVSAITGAAEGAAARRLARQSSPAARRSAGPAASTQQGGQQ